LADGWLLAQSAVIRAIHPAIRPSASHPASYMKGKQLLADRRMAVWMAGG